MKSDRNRQEPEAGFQWDPRLKYLYFGALMLIFSITDSLADLSEFHF